jgi:hypothetical protein
MPVCLFHVFLIFSYFTVKSVLQSINFLFFLHVFTLVFGLGIGKVTLNITRRGVKSLTPNPYPLRNTRRYRYLYPHLWVRLCRDGKSVAKKS